MPPFTALVIAVTQSAGGVGGNGRCTINCRVARSSRRRRGGDIENLVGDLQVRQIPLGEPLEIPGVAELVL